MSKFGSGLSLDEQWDLYVDGSTGDLAIDRASKEVQKDLAFNLGRYLQQFVGDYISDGRRADIRLQVRKLIKSDTRIENVESVSVITPSTNPNEIEVEVTAETVDGETIEGVFTAS